MNGGVFLRKPDWKTESRPVRQQILRSTYLLRRKNSKIYIVEDLTKRTLDLFHAARDAVGVSEKKMIVTRNGHVYRKLSDNSLKKVTVTEIVATQHQQKQQQSQTGPSTSSTGGADIVLKDRLDDDLVQVIS
ncbi:unnamed protein product [Didymodactylos carnosus]|uniref:Uncharacterized protein n=1 Tax=Didymodactylos carnosus TaxID=1234261 RepID=A0A814IW59_9BILA|nr:unnamed protein product [Didymodactylos carnosus]CAF1377642.1 unnamed protein product [Didymodactylos carnosus]CAF3799645.1 unnamed protein product [Didymodactylos carnosus]CAF4186304.1 unnamed protein product [Didymodactylos carnosus]